MVVIRPRNWDQLDDILKALWHSEVPYEFLGFGCISAQQRTTEFLTAQGYDVEEPEFAKILRDKEGRNRYLAHRRHYYGLSELRE